MIDDDTLTVSSSDDPDRESAMKRRRDRDGREATSGGRRRQEIYEEGNSEEEFDKRTDGAGSLGEDLQDMIRDAEGQGESPRTSGRRSKASGGYLDMAADKQVRKKSHLFFCFFLVWETTSSLVGIVCFSINKREKSSRASHREFPGMGKGNRVLQAPLLGGTD